MDAGVSFIVPVYNGSRYLDEAVTSIFGQSHPHWRLYLVDDCSSDGSRDMIAGYDDPRVIRIYNRRNVGLYQVLVETISAVDSEWVSIVMQDDRLHPTYLEELIGLAERYPEIDVFSCGSDEIAADGSMLRKGSDSGRICRTEPGAGQWQVGLRRGCIWGISGSFTRTRLLKSLPFRTDLPHCGDYEWLLRAFRLVSFVNVEKALIDIRIHKGSASYPNLESGRDVREGYGILRDNLTVYRRDLSWWTATRVCMNRARLVLMKTLGACKRLRMGYATWLSLYALRFALLPLMSRRGQRVCDSRQP